MARSSTTWLPGQNPVKRKGQRHRSTRLREDLGLSGWDALAHYIKTEGADALIRKMKALPPREYVKAYAMLAEYVKPKLSRIDATVDNTAARNALMMVEVPDDAFTVEELRLLSGRTTDDVPVELAARFLDTIEDQINPKK